LIWFPEDWIDEVVSRNDIVDVVSEYVALKPSGRSYFALCPFHNEKTASFHVSPEKQIYHCFGCGEGGNVVTFVMNMERMDFIEAMKYLAERAGVSLPEGTDAKRAAQEQNERQHLYDINKECARFFHQNLMKAEGKRALDYLYSRGLDMHTIRKFGLGYAPSSWNSARDHLLKVGYTDEQLLKAGITVQGSDKESIYDRFRNRIMFPIFNRRGAILGFGGRVLDDSLPKYLNSPDTPVFNKSRNLFGLHLAAKVKPLEFLILVEGYMDVISLHQFGFSQAVATLGTSLTAEQAKLMRRYSPDIYIAYDGDTSGQKAAMRALDILQEAGCKPRVMEFPKELDPDEILKMYGPEYFRKLMDKSLPFIEYKLFKLRKQHDLNSVEGKVKYASAAAEVLATVENYIERDAYIKELESLLGIRSRAIYDQIAKVQAAGQKQIKQQRNRTGNYRYTKNKLSSSVLKPGTIRAEAYLVNLMVQDASIARKVLKGLEGLTLQEPLYQRIVEIVKNLLDRKGEVSEAQVLNHLESKEDIKKLAELFQRNIEYDNIDIFLSDCLNQVAMGILEKQRREIQEEINIMDREGIPDPVRYKSLLKELQLLNHKMSIYRFGKEGNA
jgi:DNA primase